MRIDLRVLVSSLRDLSDNSVLTEPDSNKLGMRQCHSDDGREMEASIDSIHVTSTNYRFTIRPSKSPRVTESAMVTTPNSL